MNCTNCGAQLAEGAAFCPNCGTAQASAAPAASAASDTVNAAGAAGVAAGAAAGVAAGAAADQGYQAPSYAQPQQQQAQQQPTYAQPQQQQSYQQPTYAQPQQQAYQQPYQQQAPVKAKSKVTAGVLGIIFGGFGVHKFYLGYRKEGAIMLILYIVGLLLSFIGVGVFICVIIAIIGLVEGIMYLTKSDDVFYQTYVVGHKGWF